MSAISLTISWEDQLLMEAERELSAASAKEELARAVWSLVRLGYGKLAGGSLLEGAGAGGGELLRGWAAYSRTPAQLLQELRMLSQYEAQLDADVPVSLPVLTLHAGRLRAMGRQMLALLRTAAPRPYRRPSAGTGGKHSDAAAGFIL
ncbi:hypothetical protein SAMN02799630_05086 [Paenibacillus sp. UNCCL117]|uniref:hypothetical protein n=1 Tax=unclassified Paenibacillus TaxID=185978 RepID=UPI0008892DC9|nr:MULTISPECIES: hypothetical protein [unclassified Paenibacillus]SDE30410.1 hypothetical protein SAMN04488602_12472 [Paenibacillus sp. cl123]SFW63087.1 hypothetical protein SAMN02799630_05086 [Paenibacillus sp. UNCCL117]